MSSLLCRLARLIPAVSAVELGVFRVLFAAGAAWAFSIYRLEPAPFPHELHLTAHPLAQFAWVHDLAANPAAVGHLQRAIDVLFVLFAAGAAARVSFALLTAALTVWTLVWLTHTGAHPWAVLIVTLWAMLPVRWGDGFSLDALARRLRRVARPLGRTAGYGYALWIPGLTWGMAMFSAGVAKLEHSGLSWITNGSVRYFFVIDAQNAPTDWGLWVAARPWASVLLSGGAVLTELTLVLAVLIPSYRRRAPWAVAGALLLGGFYTFQNEVWPAWWLLWAAFFLPWPLLTRALRRLARRSTPAAEAQPSGLTAAHVIAAVLVVCLQLAASAMRVELAPVMSDYPMYSRTFASIGDFESQSALPPEYRFAVVFEGDSRERDASEDFDQLKLHEPVREAYLDISERRLGPADVRDVIDRTLATLDAHYGRRVDRIIVKVNRRGFDWARGTFGYRTRDETVIVFPLDGRAAVEPDAARN